MYKTFIRWSGNKSKYIRHIVPLFPTKIGTYFEPFLGSGSIFLHLKPKKWVVNDMNFDLINAWKSIKDSPDEVFSEMKKIASYLKTLDNVSKLNYCKRKTKSIEHISCNNKRAAVFIAMKYCAYMGHICIRNKFYFPSLDIKVQNNHYYFATKQYLKTLNNASMFLKYNKGIILNTNYSNALTTAKKGDFVFVDPPYIENHKYQFNYNTNESLNTKFIDELYDNLVKLDKRGVKWLMTQADDDYVKVKFKQFKISSFPVYRFASNTHKEEIIIKNY